MASWESQSPSSINTVQINSQSSEMNTRLESKEEEAMCRENVCTVEYSLNARCNGVMGVPITFLDKWCPDQFEILGITDRQNTSGLRTKNIQKVIALNITT